MSLVPKGYSRSGAEGTDAPSVDLCGFPNEETLVELQGVWNCDPCIVQTGAPCTAGGAGAQRSPPRDPARASDIGRVAARRRRSGAPRAPRARRGREGCQPEGCQGGGGWPHSGSVYAGPLNCCAPGMCIRLAGTYREYTCARRTHEHCIQKTIVKSGVLMDHLAQRSTSTSPPEGYSVKCTPPRPSRRTRHPLVTETPGGEACLHAALPPALTPHPRPTMRGEDAYACWRCGWLSTPPEDAPLSRENGGSPLRRRTKEVGAVPRGWQCRVVSRARSTHRIKRPLPPLVPRRAARIRSRGGGPRILAACLAEAIAFMCCVDVHIVSEARTLATPQTNPVAPPPRRHIPASVPFREEETLTAATTPPRGVTTRPKFAFVVAECSCRLPGGNNMDIKYCSETLYWSEGEGRARMRDVNFLRGRAERV
eukprot:gene12445-biopygen10998